MLHHFGLPVFPLQVKKREIELFVDILGFDGVKELKVGFLPHLV